MYDAFISYSHNKDKPIAEALQAVLQKLGKPWYRRRALRVFRDDTSLTATPGLWPSIETALSASRYLVLLASPEAAASPWVGKEVDYWLNHKGADTLLVALTSGELRWDGAHGDFAANAPATLPAVLKGRFVTEPKWVDVRSYRDAPGDASLRNPEFASRAADIAAAVHGMPKEEILSEELTQQRRALRLAWSAAALLLMLGGAAFWQWQLANIAKNNAQHTLAHADQQKAVELFTRNGTTHETSRRAALALAYLARAVRSYPSDGATGVQALYLMAEHPHLYPGGSATVARTQLTEPRTLRLDEGNRGARARKVVKSPDGTWEMSLDGPLRVRRKVENDWRTVKEDWEVFDYTAAAFSEHSRYAAAAGGIWGEFGGRAEVKIVDSAGSLLAKRVFDGERIEGVTLAPNGRLLFVSLFSPTAGGGGTMHAKARTVLLDVAPVGWRVELAELRVLPLAVKSIRFSADSRHAVLDGRPYAVGPVLENEPFPRMVEGRPYFSADGTRIIVQSEDVVSREPVRRIYDAASGAALPGDAAANLPAGSDRSAAVKAAASAGGVLVTVGGKAVLKANDSRILLVGVNASGDRLIFLRDDGSAQVVATSSGALGAEWRPLKSVYGHPWHDWTQDFLTVADGKADWWARVYRKEYVDDRAWQQAFKAIAHDFVDGSTTVALHPSGTIAAIASMGHNRAEVKLVDVRTGVSLWDTIVIADQNVEAFFSRDGKRLFVHAHSTGSSKGAFEMRDVAGGLPLRSRIYGGPFAERPDGKRMLDGGDEGSSQLFDLLGGEAPVPHWVADLAEGLSGLRLNDRSVPVTLSMEEQSVLIESARKALAAPATSSDRWSAFGRWYFAADSDPLISPYSEMRCSRLAEPMRSEDRALNQRSASPTPPELGASYFVQVGAFTDRGEAERQLALVATRFDKLVQNRPAGIVVLEEGCGQKHRARFTGFAEAEARAACAAFKLQGIDCFVAVGN
jgi:TIR domain/SPOR domain